MGDFMVTHWDQTFMDMAELIASRSKDPSTKVGCVITDSHNRILGVGYNGFPRGVADTPERYDDRETKYAMVQHAELNAVLNSNHSLIGATAYVTHHPCSHCAGVLIQAGITKIVTYEPDAGLAERFRKSFQIAEIMLNEAGVVVVKLSGGTL